MFRQRGKPRHCDCFGQWGRVMAQLGLRGPISNYSACWSACEQGTTPLVGGERAGAPALNREVIAKMGRLAALLGRLASARRGILPNLNTTRKNLPLSCQLI